MSTSPTSDDGQTAAAAAAAAIEDPLLHKPLGTLRMVRRVVRDGGRAHVEIALPAPEYPYVELLRATLADQLAALDGVTDVVVEFQLMDDPEVIGLLQAIGYKPGGGQLRESVFATGESDARVIAVASGKGGVGKSSITTNLSVALARLGATVGTLDADVWGFSIPRMLGVDHPPIAIGTQGNGIMIPPETFGVRAISMGYFVDEDAPVMWRGPMLHKAMEQFLNDVWWGDLDYLVIDMPPGTGDISLSMSQMLPTAEVLVVTTPQPAAQRVAVRAGKMAEKVNQRILGVVENMSWLELPGGERRAVFGEGGGAELAAQLGVELLAQVPLDEELREGADEGRPIVAHNPDAAASRAIAQVAEQIHAQKRKKIRRPQLKITPA